eukprot:12012150-Karenia_brevis.AAC.1
MPIPTMVHTLLQSFKWHYGTSDSGELTCPAVPNYEDPHIIGLRMLAYTFLTYCFLIAWITRQ